MTQAKSILIIKILKYKLTNTTKYSKNGTHKNEWDYRKNKKYIFTYGTNGSSNWNNHLNKNATQVFLSKNNIFPFELSNSTLCFCNFLSQNI